MTENDRVKIVRKSPEVSLTMEKFGQRLGVGKSTISSIESGANAVTPQMRRSICREFHVSETWLETGVGEMFEEQEDFSLDEFLKEHDADQLEIAIVKAYFELDPELRRRVVSQLLENLRRDENQQSETTEELEAEYEKSIRRNSSSVQNTDSTASTTIEDA